MILLGKYFHFFVSKYFRFQFIFYVKIAPPSPPSTPHLLKKKFSPLFPSNPPLKVEVLSSPLFLKIWLEVQPHGRKVGVHYVSVPWRYFLRRTSKNWCFFSLLSIIVNVIIIAFCLYFYCFCLIFLLEYQ